MTSGVPAWIIPTGASVDARWILAARAVRAFADGCVSLLLPIYLLELGFGALAIGSIITSTLIGSALLTLTIGLIAHRFPRRALLQWASLLMVATGGAFAQEEAAVLFGHGTDPMAKGAPPASRR